MPEIGTSGSMSEDGKRSIGHRPQATVPILDSTRARADLGWIELEMQHECHQRAGGQPSASRRLDACRLHQGDIGLNLVPDQCIELLQARWARLPAQSANAHWCVNPCMQARPVPANIPQAPVVPSLADAWFSVVASLN